MPEDGNSETMLRRLYCLTMPPAQLPHEVRSWHEPGPALTSQVQCPLSDAPPPLFHPPGVCVCVCVCTRVLSAALLSGIAQMTTILQTAPNLHNCRLICYADQ